MGGQSWSLLVCFALLLAAVGGSTTVWGEVPADGAEGALPRYCDPLVLERGIEPAPYRFRGNRCEGIYRADASTGTLLQVGSFTASFDRHPAEQDRTLLLSPASPLDGLVQIRVWSMGAERYYRMDSALARGSTPLEWPLDVLAELQIRMDRIGVLGWTLLSVAGGSPQEFLLPMWALPRAAIRDSRPPTHYRLMLYPRTRLKEVWVAVSRLREDGSEEPPSIEDHPLGYRYYPERRPIQYRFSTADLSGDGIYSVRLRVQDHATGEELATPSVYFLHGGSSQVPSVQLE